MTRQEMFDRAFIGLRDQGFRRAMSDNAFSCVYLATNGDRCAWGHVDPEGTAYQVAAVRHLIDAKVGMAGELAPEDYLFAQGLQRAHDVATNATLEESLLDFAHRYNLALPSSSAE